MTAPQDQQTERPFTYQEKSMANVYLDELKTTIEAIKTKNTKTITGAIIRASNKWLEELSVFTDQDEENILLAVEWTDNEYVKPINLPGPDALIDPFVSMAIREAVKALIHYYRDGKFSQAA